MTTVEINGLKDMIACNTRISSLMIIYRIQDMIFLSLWIIKRLLRK